MLLIGAGGHARAVVEILNVTNRKVSAYVDPVCADWIACRQITSDETAISEGPAAAVLGIGGTGPQALQRRLDIMRRYADHGFSFPAIVHPRAIVSDAARIGDGVIVLAGAVVNAGARLCAGALVNSGAVVEHECHIGEGSHIAPGAILLGGALIGSASLVGAGAAVLPGAGLGDRQLVPALTRYPQ